MCANPVLVIGSKNYSSWSLRPWLHLRKVGLEFDEQLIVFNAQNYQLKIHALSPSKRVPVLITGDLTICDSLAICEYASDLTGKGLPAAVAARAMARSIACEMHSGFQSLREQCPMNVRARDRRVPTNAALQEDIARIDGIWSESRDRWRADGPWLFGQYSLADAMFAPVVFRFQTYGGALCATSTAYMNFALSDPAMREWSCAAELEQNRLPDTERAGLPT